VQLFTDHVSAAVKKGLQYARTYGSLFKRGLITSEGEVLPGLEELEEEEVEGTELTREELLKREERGERWEGW